MKYGDLPPKKVRNFSAKAKYEVKNAICKNKWSYIFFVIKLISNVCARQVSFVSVWFPIIITALSTASLACLVYLDSYTVDRNVYLNNIKHGSKPLIHSKMCDTRGTSSAVTGCIALFVLLIILIFCFISGKRFSTAEAIDMISYFFMAFYFDIFWEGGIICVKKNLASLIALIKWNSSKLQNLLFVIAIILCIAYQIYTIFSVIRNCIML